MIFRENDFWWRERWPATIATLIAIALFWLSNGPNPVIVLFMVIWLLGYVVGGRIAAGPAAIWAARLVLYLVAYFGNLGHQTNLIDTVFLAPAMSLFAQCAIAEFALRRWRAGDVPLWADILPSGLIMLAACSTTEPLNVTFLAPLYFLFIVLAFAQIGHRAYAPLPWRWVNLATRVFSLLIALGIGGFAHYCFRQYKSEILDWGGSVLGEHVSSAAKQATITGIAKAPFLGPTFNDDSPPTRMMIVHGNLHTPYLRGMPYTDYLRGSWGPSLDSRQYDHIGEDRLTVAQPAKTDTIDVERLVSDDEMVSFPLTCTAIEVPNGDEITWARSDGGPMRVSDIGTLRYRCRLPQSDTFQGFACSPPTPAQQRSLLDIPIGVDKRVVELGKKLTGGVDGQTAIRQVVGYLMSNNRYSYSTNPGLGDPVSSFILQRKSADCEYFASAATMLLRAGGIPTRFVIGYYAHETGSDGTTVVRATDAHAWAESYVGGTGWVTVDATPASGRPDVTHPLSLWWQLRDRYDDLVQRIRDRWASMSRVHQALALAGIALLILLYYAIRSRRVGRRQTKIEYGYNQPAPSLLELSTRFDRLLANCQTPCPREIPWAEHIAGLALLKADDVRFDTDLAARFVSVYSEVRFGIGVDSDMATKLSEMLGQLESEKR